MHAPASPPSPRADRIPITLETRSFAMDQPGPDSKLLQMAWAGLVRDSRAGNVIGEYSSTS